MDNYLKLILELKEKKDNLESELAKRKREQEAIKYEIEAKAFGHRLIEDKQIKYTDLKNILESYKKTINKAKKTWLGVWLCVSILLVAIIAFAAAGFISLLSEILFWDTVAFSVKLAVLPVMIFVGALCIKDYRGETAEIREIKKGYTIEELDNEIADARSKAKSYSESLASLEEVQKENDNSIKELEQQIAAIEKELEIAIESRDRAISMPQVEELLNQEFQRESELNLTRERRNTEE